MNPLVKLVLVRHTESGKAYLYEAPIEKEVLEGDTVICKTRSGEITFGIATAVTITPLCGSEYRFILKSNDAVLPLSRIIGKYTRVDF